MSISAYSALLCVNNTEKPEWLSTALDSMLNQTVKPDEIVLVQNGLLAEDLDATIYQYKEKYPEIIKILPLLDKVGLGVALRQGVFACSHGFIACMDADGYSVPTRIEEEFVALFEKKVDMLRHRRVCGFHGQCCGSSLVSRRSRTDIQVCKKKNTDGSLFGFNQKKNGACLRKL